MDKEKVKPTKVLKPIDPIEAARNEAIKRWDKVLTQAGLGGYAIDFSDVEPVLIDRIGQTIDAFLKEKKE